MTKAIVKMVMLLETLLGSVQESAIRIMDRGVVTPLQRMTSWLCRWRTTAAIQAAVKEGGLHISQLDMVSLRAFSCLPAALETDNLYLSPEFSGDPESFLRKVLEGLDVAPSEFSFSTRPWILLCLAEHWSSECWGVYKDLGVNAPNVFFAKPDGTWGVDPYGDWRDGLSPLEFELVSDFTLRVRAGFPSMKDVGWDDI